MGIMTEMEIKWVKDKLKELGCLDEYERNRMIFRCHTRKAKIWDELRIVSHHPSLYTFLYAFSSVNASFYWATTKEGTEYWREIALRLQRESARLQKESFNRFCLLLKKLKAYDKYMEESKNAGFTGKILWDQYYGPVWDLETAYAHYLSRITYRANPIYGKDYWLYITKKIKHIAHMYNIKNGDSY